MKLAHLLLYYPTLWCVCLYIIASPLVGQAAPVDLSELSEPSGIDSSLASVSRVFNTLNTRIRDNQIDGLSARGELQRCLTAVRSEYFRAGGREYPPSAWVFPLVGYDIRAVGGGRRHGYVAGPYDYFKGNRHGGHPSFDIFIRDRNQDGRDDTSDRPVTVRSLTGGVVVALERDWQPDSRLLGGRYLWIYDPAHELLVYYAHNGELSVELGEIVKPGDVLATVGRSGFNAAKRRSPTHLHLTVVRVGDGRVVPVDVYRELRNARVGTVQ